MALEEMLNITGNRKLKSHLNVIGRLEKQV